MDLVFDLFDYIKYFVFMAERKKKMGRPIKKPKDRLSEIVTLRMIPAEHKQLMKDAHESGLSVSVYLQTCWQKSRAKKKTR